MNPCCRGEHPHIELTGPAIPAQNGHLEVSPGSSPYEWNSAQPIPAQPATPLPGLSSMGSASGASVYTPGASSNAAETPYTSGSSPYVTGAPQVIAVPQLLTQADTSAPPYTQTPLIPNILPYAPTFNVPANPLLPPGYQETLSYDSVQYMNGFIRTQIGRYCTVEFLVGSSQIQTRYGRLVGVGINYILLYTAETDSLLTCDFYSIRFVSFDRYRAGTDSMELQVSR